jgi:hypothetical protein
LEIRGETTITAQDFADAQPALPGASVANWGLPWIAGCFASGMAQVLHAPDAAKIAAFAGGAFVGFILRPWVQRRVAGSTLGEKTPAELQVRYVFDEDGYRGENASRSTSARWESFHGWKERPRVFLLQASRRNWEVIPKRAFDAAGQDGLRNLLREKIVTRKAPAAWQRVVLLWFALVLIFFSFYEMFSRRR